VQLLAFILVLPFALAFYALLLVVILVLWLTTLVLKRAHNYDSAARVTTVIRALAGALNPVNWGSSR
jgi:hypothetical protein